MIYSEFDEYWLFQTSIGNTSPEDKDSMEEGWIEGRKELATKLNKELESYDYILNPESKDDIFRIIESALNNPKQ